MQAALISRYFPALEEQRHSCRFFSSTIPCCPNGEKELLKLAGKSLLAHKDEAFYPDAEGEKWRWKKMIRDRGILTSS